VVPELQSPGATQDETRQRWTELMVGVSMSRSSNIPLHAQISQILVELIEGGKLAHGERLPPERYLAEYFDVSLAPVRQAILDTVNKGLLVRGRGHGTFVRTPGLDEKISILASLTESLRDQQVEVATQVLRQERVPTPPPVAQALGMRGGHSIYLERLAVLGREPVALLETYLSARAYPGLLDVSFAGRSLYELLEERYGTVVTWAESVIDVTQCTSREAEKLDVRVGEPLLRLEGTAFAEPKQPVEYFRVRYRANKVRFHLESRRRTDGVVRLLTSDEEQQATASPPGKPRSNRRGVA
jgi:GntR family transcriptional regulator